MVLAPLFTAHRVIRRDPRRAPPIVAAAAGCAAYAIVSGTFDALSFPQAPYSFLFSAGLIAAAASRQLADQPVAIPPRSVQRSPARQPRRSYSLAGLATGVREELVPSALALAAVVRDGLVTGTRALVTGAHALATGLLAVAVATGRRLVALAIATRRRLVALAVATRRRLVALAIATRRRLVAAVRALGAGLLALGAGLLALAVGTRRGVVTAIRALAGGLLALGSGLLALGAGLLALGAAAGRRLIAGICAVATTVAAVTTLVLHLVMGIPARLAAGVRVLARRGAAGVSNVAAHVTGAAGIQQPPAERRLPEPVQEAVGGPDLSVIVVTHNGEQFALATLQSAKAAAAGLDVQWIVVDSGSSDGTPDSIRRAHPDATVIEADNRGFAAGNNTGLELARADTCCCSTLTWRSPKAP